MITTSNKSIGYTAAVISAIILGSEGILVRNISADEYIIMLFRLGLGFLFLFTYLSYKKQLPKTGKHFVSFPLISSGVLLAFTMLFYMKAINIIPLANAVFLLFLGPILAAVISPLFLKEKYSLLNIILLIIAFLGFMLLLEFKFNFGLKDSVAYLWAACSGLCYGIYIVVNRAMPRDINTMTRSVYQLLLGFLVMLPFVFNIKDLTVTMSDLYWLVGISFFQGFVGITLIIVAIRHLKTVEYGTVSYIEPLVASVIGYLQYNESLSSMQVMGCALILTGGIIQIYKSAQKI